jgi:hypothetical protein
MKIAIAVVIALLVAAMATNTFASGKNDGKPVDHYLGTTHDGQYVYRLIVPLHSRNLECITVGGNTEIAPSCNWQKWNKQ